MFQVFISAYISYRLCEAVERAQMPVNLVADLEAQLRRSIGDNFVDRSYAVRSSAVGELLGITLPGLNTYVICYGCLFFVAKSRRARLSIA